MTDYSFTSNPRRVALMDELRGLSILLMVVYHGAYDLVAIFNLNIPIFYSPILFFLQALFAGLFVFISGISCRYSHNNLRRGVLAFLFGLALTLITWLFLPSQIIVFGILHCLGICMMVFGLCHKLLDRLSPLLGILLCLGLFFLTYQVQNGVLGIPPLAVRLPSFLYSAKLLVFLGFPGPNFFSSDYFPLLPWLFLFLAGGYFGVYVRQERLPDFVYTPHIPFLGRIGRYTLWIYLLHQPVIYGALSLFFMLTR